MAQFLSENQLIHMDEFDRIQLGGVIRICQQAKSMAEAGRRLFAASRQQRSSNNDSDRAKKYLARFGLSWDDLHTKSGHAQHYSG